MRTTALSFFITWSMLLASGGLHAQWEEVGPPLRETATRLVVDGSRILAETAGMYRSTDGGAHWALSLSYIQSYSLAASGDTVIISEYDGCFRSTDFGGSWAPITIPSNGTITRLTAAGTNFFAGNGNGVFRSTDGGEGWTAVNNGLTNVNYYEPIQSLGAMGNRLFAATVRGLFLSVDAGDHWSFINGPGSIELFATAGPMLFAGSRVYGLYSSADSGRTFVEAGIPEKKINAIAGWGSEALVGTDSALYLSTIGGVPWTRSSDKRTAHGVYALGVNDNSIFAAGAYNGIFYSSDGGVSWNTLAEGVRPAGYGIIASGGTLFTNGYLYMSTDTARTWRFIGDGIGSNGYYGYTMCFANSGNRLYVGGASGGGLYYSTDGGADWIKASLSSDLTVYSLAALGTNAIAWAHDSYYPETEPWGIYLSTDGGSSWALVNSSFAVHDFAVSGAAIFAASSGYGNVGDGVYVSPDAGMTWNPTGLKLDGYAANPGTVYDLALDSSGLYAAAGYAGVFHAKNDGTNWSLFGLKGKDIRSIAVAPGKVFVVMPANINGPGGIWFTDNDGLTWGSASDGLLPSGDVAYFADQIYVNTSAGLFRRPVDGLINSVEEAPAALPTQMALLQNYPNPFNPTTIIKYTVGAAGGGWQVAGGAGAWGRGPGARKTMLTVYDLLGRQVATLVDEVKAPGSYEVRFDGSGLASGVYFYRLTAGSYSETKQMVLVR